MNYLQAGAIGIGLAVLVYTARLLSQELKRPKLRVEARNLILVYMAFSLIAFAVAGFIELRKDSMNFDYQKKLSDIGSTVANMDGNLGGKNQAAIDDLPVSAKKTLQYFENQLCTDIKKLNDILGQNQPTQCKIVSIPQ